MRHRVRAASDFIKAAYSIPISADIFHTKSLHRCTPLRCCWKIEMPRGSFWNQTTFRNVALPANFAVQNRTLCFYGPARNETAALTDKRRAKGHLTTEQSGKTCLDRAYRLFSVISAYLAAALTASAGRASPGHAQKDGERACLHPECREKALASSSHTVWFSLLDKHSECWSMSHPQAAISALSRRPTAQLSLSLFLFLSRSNVQRI